MLGIFLQNVTHAIRWKNVNNALNKYFELMEWRQSMLISYREHCEAMINCAVCFRSKKSKTLNLFK